MSVPDIRFAVRSSSHSADVKYYHQLIESAVQPTSLASAEDIVAGMIPRLLPLDKAEDNASLFFLAVIHTSEQIPYDHPSMDKLVDILDCVFKPDSLKHMESLGIDFMPEVFNMTVNDWSHGVQSQDSVTQVNAASCLARIEARGLPSGKRWLDGVDMALRPLLDEWSDEWGDEWTAKGFDNHQGEAMAAAQWILISGRHLFGYYHHPEQHPTLNPEDYSLSIWREYRQAFDAVANGGWDGRGFTCSDECKTLAAKAAAEMLSLEREAGVEGSVASQALANTHL